MSIFATVAVVCTMAVCNDYHIDQASTLEDGVTNTRSHESGFLKVWEDEKGLTDWLTRYQIGETIFEIQTLEFETQEVQEVDLP